MKILQVFILLLFFAHSGFAQNIGKVDLNLNYTETYKIYSNIVSDTFFVYLKLPKEYSPEKKYPILYLLDGDILFPMAYGEIRYLQYGNYVPDLIIVGIGYGTLMSSKKNGMRERDYSLTEDPHNKETGHAEKFLLALQKEIQPFVEGKYSVDKNNRILFGHSLGGLFALYAYSSRCELFDSYIISSPYISKNIEDLETYYILEDKNHQNFKGNLIISIGGKEDVVEFISPVYTFVKFLKAKNYMKDRLLLKLFEEGEHFTVPGESLVFGMKYIFSKK